MSTSALSSCLVEKKVNVLSIPHFFLCAVPVHSFQRGPALLVWGKNNSNNLPLSVARGNWSFGIQLNIPHVNTRANCSYMCRLSDGLQNIAKSARALEGFQFLWLVCDLFMCAVLINEVKNLLHLSMKGPFGLATALTLLVMSYRKQLGLLIHFYTGH